jgi:phosphoglycolate phosphatase
MPQHSQPRILLVITDLDNTLWDWITFFVQAFYEMVAVAAPMLGVSEDELADELREVHQRHGNSEQPFALIETEAARARFPDLDRKGLARKLDDAFHAFNSSRKRNLALYPGVLETLETLHGRGVPVVGHTEATVPNAVFRLQSLGVAPYLRKLFAVEPSGEGHPDPTEKTLAAAAEIEVRYLGQDERKPDPRVIADICSEFAVPPSQTLYVGDSISRDIGMAREIGAFSAWAEYGTKFDERLWHRLVRVTHWTAEDVARAQAAQARYGDTKPDVVLRTSFAEILDHFDFESGSP